MTNNNLLAILLLNALPTKVGSTKVNHKRHNIIFKVYCSSDNSTHILTNYKEALAKFEEKKKLTHDSIMFIQLVSKKSNDDLKDFEVVNNYFDKEKNVQYVTEQLAKRV